MKQYYIKYSLNGKPAHFTYASSIDVDPGINAMDSMDKILTAVVKAHNAVPQFAPVRIIKEDIAVVLLTRLN